MKRILLPIIALLATLSVTAQTTVVLTGDKKGDTRVMVSNVQVAFAENRTMLSLDFILDSLRVSSNRYRAFTPVIVSKNDSTQRQRMKTFITGCGVQEAPKNDVDTSKPKDNEAGSSNGGSNSNSGSGNSNSGSDGNGGGGNSDSPIDDD